MANRLKSVVRTSLVAASLNEEGSRKVKSSRSKGDPKDRKGWLEKRGPTAEMQWHRRWCVLKEDSMIMYVDQEAEKAGHKKFEIELNEYTKAVEFRKIDAPGDSVKHVGEKPFGFVIDTEPSGGPDRHSLYYFAAEDNELLNAWIVAIYKNVKNLKNLAPSRRTSLSEFVALWKAPLLVLAAPCDGQAGALMSATCKTIIQGTKSQRVSIHGGVIDQAVSWFGNWLQTESEGKDTKPKPPKAFPLGSCLSVATEFEDSSAARFWESRIRTCTAAQTVNGKADLEANYQPAFRGPGEWSEALRQQMAIENSFMFCHWRGKTSGILSQAFIDLGDVKLPGTETAVETPLGEMSQASAQGLQVDKKADEKTAENVRVVVVVSVAGGPVVDTQRKHIPGVCKDVLKDLKQTYAWADNAWIVWCDFPNVEEFVKSLSGSRCLTPDSSTDAIQIDNGQNPTSYVVQKYRRQPQAPSLLGTSSVRDVLTQAHKIVNEVVENLFSAADAGDIKEVVAALERSPSLNPNTTDDSGTCAMSIAAAGGHLEVVRELIARKGNVNSQDNEGDSVLACAVGEGQTEVVKLLLEQRADPKVGVSGSWLDEEAGETVRESFSLLEVATSKGFDDIVELLTPTTGKAPPGAFGATMSLADELLMR